MNVSRLPKSVTALCAECHRTYAGTEQVAVQIGDGTTHLCESCSLDLAQQILATQHAFARDRAREIQDFVRELDRFGKTPDE
jgi:hypothetical protein